MSNNIDARTEGFISTSEVAQLFGVTPRTMSNWANKGYGPKRYMFTPRCARYKVEDVKQWIDSQTR